MGDYWWNHRARGGCRTSSSGWCAGPPSPIPPWRRKDAHHEHHNVGPYDLEGTDWDREKQPFLERSIEYLTRNAVPGLADHVKVAEVITPLDYERRLLHPGGAIYGLQEDLSAQVVFRPNSRSRSISGLYLAGASTHPGGGVPVVIGSGIVAADLVDRYGP